MRMKTLLIPMLAGVALAFSVNSLCAQSYSIDWHKIAGGGGTSSNGQYTVSGTIGQHDAGAPMTGGGFSLTGGFFGPVPLQKAPAPPFSTSPPPTTPIVHSPPPPPTPLSIS